MSYSTNHKSAFQYLTLLVLLSVFWLLMSGHYTVLITALGAASLLLVMFCVWRMELLDYEVRIGSLRIFKLFGYYLWLLKEVIVSNLTVARYILSRSLPIKPGLFHVPATQKTALGKVLYANSITLTPGTISLDVDEGLILVHALETESAEAGLQSGDMANRVNELEAV